MLMLMLLIGLPPVLGGSPNRPPFEQEHEKEE